MTVIHGDITRIYEIDKDAYTQSIAGSPRIDAYSFAGVVAGTSTGFLDIDPGDFETGSLFHSLNISSGSAQIQRVYFIKYPEATILFHAYFRYDSEHQFFLGDFSAYLNLGEYIRIYLENNSVGNIRFEGTIWWLTPG